MRASIASRALVLAALPALGGCGDDPPAGAGDAPTSTAPERAESPPEDFDHLRALGYVSWDEDADESRSGVVLFDRERAAPGYNAWSNDHDEVYLGDLEGRILHTWRLPQAKQLEVFALMPDGGIVVVSSQQLVARLDFDSNVIWWHRMPVHHDVRRNPDGTLLVPYSGPGRRFLGRRVRFDGIQRMSADGEVIERWFTWDRLDELQALHAPTRLDVPPEEGGPEDVGTYEYYHLNSVQRLGDTELGRRDARFREGNLLTCLRNVHLVCVLDRDTKEPVWSWGEGELQLPHMPTLLEDGRMLVFDNGTWRGWSRVIELDPVEGTIEWSYEGTPRESFFSEWRGSAQRLAGGNTLICEAERGRAFEVDRDGRIVWEFWNPEVVDGKRKRIYRFLRLERAEVAPVLERLGE